METATVTYSGMQATVVDKPKECVGEEAGVFFPVSLFKLAVMCVCTLTLYQVYWFYQNWSLIKERTHRDISPFWRAWFAVFYCWPLFRQMKEFANSQGTQVAINIPLLACASIILAVTSGLPDPYWLLSFATFVPLLFMQKLVNQINTTTMPSAPANDRFSGLNMVAIVLGGLLVVLAIIGTLIPK